MGGPREPRVYLGDATTSPAYAPTKALGDPEILQLAVLASDPATQDPIDLAIIEAAQQTPASSMERIGFVPFDPETKRAEAICQRDGIEWRVIKGAPQVITAIASHEHDYSRELAAMAERGCRVLAIAAGPRAGIRLVGFVGLLDPPREDSRAVVARLRELGLRVIMVTGDSAPTARALAAEIGIGPRVATKADADPSTLDVLAGVLPEDKFLLVRTLQGLGHVVGMTGDGVNDAPALKQADVGVAVASAVDVAKSAASVVLTQPGLAGVLAAVDVGRRIYQRMLTYTLNMSVKKLEIPVFLALAFLVFKTYAVPPRLLLLLMVTNDLSTMTLASDRVQPSSGPERWKGRSLVLRAVAIALPWLAFLVTTFIVGRSFVRLSPGALQSLSFLTLVFMGQANVYLVRERRHLWRSMPGHWTLIATIITVVIVSMMAMFGVFMVSLAPIVVVSLLASVVVFMLVLDVGKVQIFKRA